MNTEPTENTGRSLMDLPAWEECDYFCIHDYAGLAAAPCGWRGRSSQVERDETGARLLCPLCGCMTLLRIPVAGSQ
jgi:hypothetical protein